METSHRIRYIILALEAVLLTNDPNTIIEFLKEHCLFESCSFKFIENREEAERKEIWNFDFATIVQLIPLISLTFPDLIFLVHSYQIKTNPLYQDTFHSLVKFTFSGTSIMNFLSLLKQIEHDNLLQSYFRKIKTSEIHFLSFHPNRKGAKYSSCPIGKFVNTMRLDAEINRLKSATYKQKKSIQIHLKDWKSFKCSFLDSLLRYNMEYEKIKTVNFVILNLGDVQTRQTNLSINNCWGLDSQIKKQEAKNHPQNTKKYPTERINKNKQLNIESKLSNSSDMIQESSEKFSRRYTTRSSLKTLVGSPPLSKLPLPLVACMKSTEMSLIDNKTSFKNRSILKNNQKNNQKNIQKHSFKKNDRQKSFFSFPKSFESVPQQLDLLDVPDPSLSDSDEDSFLQICYQKEINYNSPTSIKVHIIGRLNLIFDANQKIQTFTFEFSHVI